MIPTVEMHQLHPSLDPNTTGYILVQQAETVSLPVSHHLHQGAIKSENNDPESIDEFLRATNIEDFLWYNCPNWLGPFVHGHQFFGDRLSRGTNQFTMGKMTLIKGSL